MTAITNDYMPARLALHHAAQIPAALSSLLEAQEDYSHTTLSLHEGCLVSQSLPDGRRAGVHIESLQLRLGAMSAPARTFELVGQTKDEGLRWLSAELGAKLEFLSHDLPPWSGGVFEAHDDAALATWITMGDGVLRDVGGAGASPLRLWPHHFDMAVLVSLDEGGGEDARSINVGLSLGDESYAEPYWYVTPWPTPQAELPALPCGTWHREGFTAAVFRAREHSPGSESKEARAFVRDALAASHSLLD